MESIIGQDTIYKWQVIIINDGSTDNTLELCKKYKDNRHISIINQENRGFSGARNRGLENICAQYVMFVDSDDILEPNAIQKLLECAFSGNFDVVEGNFYNLVDSKRTVGSSYINRFLNNPVESLRGFPWGKVIRSEFFQSIKFPEGYWYEDSIISFLIYPLCKNVATIDTFVYTYRRNPQGVSMGSKGKGKTIDTYWIIEEMFDSINYLKINIMDIYELFLSHVQLSFSRICYLNKEIRKNVFAGFCELEKKYFYSKKTARIDLQGVEASLKDCDFGLWELNGKL